MGEWLMPGDDEIVEDARRQVRVAHLHVGWWAEWYGVPEQVVQTRLDALVAARKLAVRRSGGMRVYGPRTTIGDVIEDVRRALATKAEGKGLVTVSAKALAGELGVSPQDAWLAMRRLEERGVVKRLVVCRGRGGSTWRMEGQ